MFDVDYTLLRPNEMFYAPGYKVMGERFGLQLDVGRWHEAERAAYMAVRERRQRLGLVHDSGFYDAIALAVITAMGGGDAETVRRCAAAVIAEWTRCENFTLYDDVTPCLERLRGAGLKIALVSNTNRDLAEVLEHFRLAPLVDAAVTSLEVGEFKPSPKIYQTALDAVGVRASEAVMVGDSLEDDVRGAMALGIAALLLDRAGKFGGDSAPDVDAPKIGSLAELPAALGL
jgi:HAD superfamily hydrolase (TIGR01509 family)